MKNKTFKRIVYRGKVRFRICPRCGGTGTFIAGKHVIIVMVQVQ